VKFGDRFPPPSQPRKAVGGIRARSKRGAFGTAWWAKRWIEVLEAFENGSRLARGRSYARAGQVLDLRVDAGLVTAKVQGSRVRPYAVTIRVAPLGKPTWERVGEMIEAEARFVASLLANEMPHDIERAFSAAGTSLFPATLREIHTDCSCPDWSNPCKHVAATYYLLGEEFDRDPFLLFALRGMPKAALLARIGGHANTPERPTRKRATPSAGGEPLPNDPTAFWRGRGASTPPATADVRATTAPQLPAFPFWRGSEPLEDFVMRTSERASAAALDFLADTDVRQTG
jgi:uncharacterized Zn finger protein